MGLLLPMRLGRTRPSLMTRPALVLLLLLQGTVGQAATPDRCQTDRVCAELNEKASQLVAQRRYEEALLLYQGAYNVTHEPLVLINIGRCHYRMGRARKALEFYTSYTKAEPDPDPEVRSRLEQWRAEAEQAIRADEEGPGASPALKEPEPPPAPVLVAPPGKGPGDEPAPPLKKSRRSLSPVRLGLGISALGIGATLLGLGAGALSVNGSCATPSPSSPGRCTPDVASDGTQVATFIDGKSAGAALLATGGLVVVGGVLLIALPGRRAAK